MVVVVVISASLVPSAWPKRSISLPTYGSLVDNIAHDRIQSRMAKGVDNSQLSSLVSVTELKAKTGAHTKHNETTLVLPWITIYIHFLHTYPNSLACLPDTMKTKTCSAMVPLQKNSKVKAPSHYVVHVAPPHSAFTTSDGSIEGGIAETRDFIKQRDSNQSMPGSLK